MEWTTTLSETHSNDNQQIVTILQGETAEDLKQVWLWE